MTSTLDLDETLKKKGVILDTWSLTEQLVMLTKEYEIKHFGQEISKLTKQRAFQIIVACVNCHLNARMLWAREKIDFEEVVEEYIGWVKEKSLVGNTVRSDYLLNIVDCIEMQLIYRLNEFIGGKTWDVWTLSPLGYDIILKNTGDYRVHDWYRRLTTEERRLYAQNIPL